MPHVVARLDVEVAAEGVPALAAAWLDQATAALAPDLRGEVDAGRAVHLKRRAWPGGVPPVTVPAGTVVASLAQHWFEDGTSRPKHYDGRWTSRGLATLAGLAARAEHATTRVTMLRAGPGGYPEDAAETVCAETMRLRPSASRFLRLAAWADPGRVRSTGAATQEALVDLCVTFSRDHAVVHGEVTFLVSGGPGPMWTNLELCMTPNPERPGGVLPTFVTDGGDPVAHSREVLRGYGWATVLAPEHVVRLGGSGALSTSAAFARFEPLPSGGAVVVARGDLAGYGPDQARPVWEALRSALRHGPVDVGRLNRKGFGTNDPVPAIVVPEDAGY